MEHFSGRCGWFAGMPDFESTPQSQSKAVFHETYTAIAIHVSRVYNTCSTDSGVGGVL